MGKKKAPRSSSRAAPAKRSAARKHGESEFYWWTYEDLERLTGKDIQAIYQHRSRGNFDPEDLESVLVWIAKHGTADVRQAMIQAAFAPVGTSTKKKSQK